MEDYRSLTEEEITQLEAQGCYANDWTSVCVAEEFDATWVRNTDFYGEVYLGVFNKNIEVDEGFLAHSGINGATLNDVTVGDNCIIAHIGNFIHNCDIGEECCLMNVGCVTTNSGANYGEGNNVAVLNEGGNGNVTLFSGLTSQLAALMVRHASDTQFSQAIRQLVKDDIAMRSPERSQIGYRVKITNTTELTNVVVNDDCEISGACRLSDCTILSTPDAATYIGNGVIIDNSIVQAGSSILDGAKVDNCFVGEACHIGKGASAESSLFFANSWLDNGETCAAFCGPFSVSHHKSSLLIGGNFAFYNAGSATNFSNHAYKMGPLHWGTLERGCKTASGAHVLWPASIGAFSMIMGKVANHPNLGSLPFSYVFGQSDGTYVVPGRNLSTVGTWRDTTKWPKRDRRPYSERDSLVNFDWLNPRVVLECIRGRKILNDLKALQGDAASYTHEGCVIRHESLLHGIKAYDTAIRMYIGQALAEHDVTLPESSTGTGEWNDLSGMLIPDSEEERLVDDVKDGRLADTMAVAKRLEWANTMYKEWKWNFTYRIVCDVCHLETLTSADVERIRTLCASAHEAWLKAIAFDAEKEFRLGDVDEDTLSNFLKTVK